MTLTRLVLDPRHPEAQRDLAVPYELHRTLARAFPPVPDGVGYRQAHGVLFRIEPPASGRRGRVVLVQATVSPDTTAFPTGYLLETDIKPFNPAIATGQVLGFRLLANPARQERAPRDAPKRPSGKDARSIRRAEPVMGDTYGASPALDWLMRQGQRHGFDVLHTSLQPVEPPRLADGKGDLPHQGVLFDGRLRVTDAEALRSALASGIGPAKAFGFGLLSLAPAPGV